MKKDKRYLRLKDESIEDYNYRMCRQKDLGIYDLTWKELRDILNEENDEIYGESKWRKDYQVVQRYLDGRTESNQIDQEVLDEMRQAKMELEMTKKQVQTETIYNNRVLREHSRYDLQKEKTVTAIQRADKIKLPNFDELKPKKYSDKEYLLGVSDVHAYKKFVSITNEYSKDILEERMADLLQQVKEQIEHEGIETLYVLNGGDSLENILRNSALSILELGVIDTVVEYRRFMAKWLSDLSKYVKIKYIHLISSNHSEYRVLNMRAGQMPQEDLEKDIANYIHDILDTNDRIEVIVPETPYYHLKIAGQDLLCHHGHGIGNPKTYLDSMSRKLKVWFTALVVGHLHSEKIETIYEDIDGGDVELLRLPSIVGSCSFADKINKGSKASAIMFRFDENKGRDREYKFILN